VQEEEILAQRQQLQTKGGQLAWRQAEIERLQLLIAKLRRMRFGRRLGKLKRQIEQLELQLDDLETAQAETRVAYPPPEATERTAQGGKPVRRMRPAHLLAQVRTIPVKDPTCPDGGGELKPLGEMSRRCWNKFVPTSKPSGRSGPSLPARAATRSCRGKRRAPHRAGSARAGVAGACRSLEYCDHLPLCRQEEICAREGVELERATLAGWVGGASQLLEPLVEALRRHVMSASKLHADDSPVPGLAPGLGRTKTGRLWTYVRDDRPRGRLRGRRCGSRACRIDKASIPKLT
jgi:transposase